jgi:hypothetical protein
MGGNCRALFYGVISVLPGGSEENHENLLEYSVCVLTFEPEFFIFESMILKWTAEKSCVIVRFRFSWVRIDFYDTFVNTMVNFLV